MLNQLAKSYGLTEAVIVWNNFKISSFKLKNNLASLIYFLEGADAIGKQYAVYDFVERSLGVRYLRPDYEQIPVLAHFKPAAINTGWRVAALGEFHNSFGYNMTVSETEPNILYCNFMERFPYETWNCKITVEGTPIATLKRGKDVSYSTRLWDATYTIPQELTKGRKTVRVMFEPLETKDVAMPRLVEMRIIKQKIELE